MTIVRHNQSAKAGWQALPEAGATEVHMRISSPPSPIPASTGIDTDNQEQL